MTTFLKISEVLERVGLSRAGVYALIKRKEFPPGVSSSESAREGGPTDEIERWQEDRRAAE